MMSEQHPSDATWMEFLYGELDADEAAKLTAHLAGCSQCSHAVAAWRDTMQELDAWEPPRNRTVPAAAAGPVSRQASTLTVALVVCAAFLCGLIGHALLTPSADELRSELRAEWNRDLQRRLATLQQTSPENGLRAAPVSQALADWEKASSVREERIRLVLSDLLQNQMTLREDLETLALEAESQILRTRAELIRLRRSVPQEPRGHFTPASGQLRDPL